MRVSPYGVLVKHTPARSLEITNCEVKMNEIQRVNALNEWFLGDCHQRSQSILRQLEAEWDLLEGKLPNFGEYVRQWFIVRWMAWVKSN